MIAAIIGAFDVVSIVELRDDLRDFMRILRLLGSRWGVVFSDYVRDAGGNRERVAFAFDRERVTFTGLASNAEGPRRRVGEEYVREVPWWRPPFLASFRAGPFDFILLAAHIRWGPTVTGRVGEIAALADWILARTKEAFSAIGTSSSWASSTPAVRAPRRYGASAREVSLSLRDSRARSAPTSPAASGTTGSSACRLTRCASPAARASSTSTAVITGPSSPGARCRSRSSPARARTTCRSGRRPGRANVRSRSTSGNRRRDGVDRQAFDGGGVRTSTPCARAKRGHGLDGVLPARPARRGARAVPSGA